MSFHIKTRHMLKKFGVDLQVWSYDKIKQTDDTSTLFGDDEPANLDLSTVEPDELHEPVFPPNPTSAILQAIGGGAELQCDLVWLSNHKYPDNSIVKVSTQDGKYRITGHSSYDGYTDNFIAYTLKGDSEHDSK